MIDELDENLTASRNQNIESPKFKMNIVLQHKTLGKFVSAQSTQKIVETLGSSKNMNFNNHGISALLQNSFIDEIDSKQFQGK